MDTERNELSKGIYDIPDGFMVKVLPGARQIEVKEYPSKYTGKYCRDCKFCVKGHWSPKYTWYDSTVCLKKPKAKHQGYYYAVTLTTKPCNQFEELNQEEQ